MVSFLISNALEYIIGNAEAHVATFNTMLAWRIHS
jgi:hypothetical protein